MLRENVKFLGAKDDPPGCSMVEEGCGGGVGDELLVLDVDDGWTSMTGNPFFLALVDPPGPAKTSGAFLLLDERRTPDFASSDGFTSSAFLTKAAGFNGGFLPITDLLPGVPILVRFALEATLDMLVALVRFMVDGALDRFMDDGPRRIPPIVFLVDLRVVLPKGLVAPPLPAFKLSL